MLSFRRELKSLRKALNGKNLKAGETERGLVFQVREKDEKKKNHRSRNIRGNFVPHWGNQLESSGENGLLGEVWPFDGGLGGVWTLLDHRNCCGVQSPRTRKHGNSDDFGKLTQKWWVGDGHLSCVGKKICGTERRGSSSLFIYIASLREFHWRGNPC